MSKHKVSGLVPADIDPFRFMELDKPDIHYKLTSELGCTEEEARREFDSMTAMLTLLKSMRCCQPQTDDYLKDAVPDLHPRVKIAAVTILLNATKGDDTYCHAHNTFVYYSNRYLRTNFPRKNISDHQLLILLEKEKAAAAVPETGKINPAAPCGSARTGKSFSGYLLHERREELAEKLKSEFSDEKGKGIRLLIEALAEHRLIAVENRQRTNIYNALKTFFARNIGSYQSIFSYPFDMVSDRKDLESIRTRLGFVLKSFNPAVASADL
jgi:hypothetical protein